MGIEEYKEKLDDFDEKIRRPLDEKIKYSLDLIKKVLENHKRCCVACSFGKDSVVMLHLVRQVDRDIPVIFSNTGVEYKETIKFKDFLVKEWNLKYFELKPIKSFWQCVEEYGFPKMRFSNPKKKRTGGKPRCCYYLKDKPAQLFYKKHGIQCVFVGLTYDESYQRKWHIIKHGAYYYIKKEKIYKALPLAYWNEKDVWKYIEMYNLPINPAYKKYNIKRIGCIPCTAHKDWEEQLKQRFPSLYRKIKKDMLGSNLDDFTLENIKKRVC